VYNGHGNITGLLGDALDQGLLDNFHALPLFENYFSICKPTTCTYVKAGHLSPVEIVTIVFGSLASVILTLKLKIVI
jgi:hypothetical protein